MLDAYGSSWTTLDFVTRHQIACIQPKTAVDFGAGAGKNGKLVREALGRECQLVAVEGYARTVEKLKRDGIYDQVCGMLISEWLRANTQHHDLAIFGDVLEHLPRREIFRTIRHALEVFGEIIIVVPLYDVCQGAAYGNALEIHRAYIDEHYFDRFNPVEKHIIKDKEHVMMNVRLNGGHSLTTSGLKLDRHRVFHYVMMTLDRMGLAKVFYNTLKRLRLLR